MPKPRATECVDCGSSDIGWSLDTYKASGPHRNRCHECYLAYTREKQNARGHGRPNHVPGSPFFGGNGRRIGPPKPRNWARSTRRIQCASCGSLTKPQNEHATCGSCAARNAGIADARRRRARRCGDKPHWSELGPNDNWICHLCGFDVLPIAGGAGQPWGATVDHVVPIAMGGDDVWSNVRLAHRWCNSKRHDRDADEVRAGIELLVWRTAPDEVIGRYRLPAA